MRVDGKRERGPLSGKLGNTRMNEGSVVRREARLYTTGCRFGSDFMQDGRRGRGCSKAEDGHEARGSSRVHLSRSKATSQAKRRWDSANAISGLRTRCCRSVTHAGVCKVAGTTAGLGRSDKQGGTERDHHTVQLSPGLGQRPGILGRGGRPRYS